MANHAVEIKRELLIEILENMRESGLVPYTYQYIGAEELEFNGSTQIRLNFSEWSYPFVAGREVSRMLPKQYYEKINFMGDKHFAQQGGGEIK